MISYPSVTEVISLYADYSKISPVVLDAACERGTKVHEICAMIARGEFVVGIDPAYQGYIDSFRRWYDAVVDVLIFAEERLADMQFGFHGQPDLLVKSKYGEILMVDLKTTAAKSKVWRLQLAAYSHLVTLAYPDTGPFRAGSLRLSPVGKTPKMDWYDGSGATDLNVFVSALNVFRYFNS